VEYRNLGASGLRVSRVCLGTMMFGDPTPEEECLRMMGETFEAGINFVDTADKYGGGASEKIVGKAIRQHRDEVVLATKVGLPAGDGPNERGTSRKHIRAAVEASLRRLQTDHIDLYYVHVYDYETPPEETLGALHDLVRAGKALYVGCSNYWAWQVARTVGLQELRGWERFVAVQPLYNIANRDVEVELLPLCHALGIGVVPYSPLARGVLTGKYGAGHSPPDGSRAHRGNKRLLETEYRDANFAIANGIADLARPLGCSVSQLAIAWVMGNPLVTAPIIGPRTLGQLRDNVGALTVGVTPEMEAAIDALVPPGEHAGAGYRDPMFPVRGRPCG